MMTRESRNIMTGKKHKDIFNFMYKRRRTSVKRSVLEEDVRVAIYDFLPFAKIAHI